MMEATASLRAVILSALLVLLGWHGTCLAADTDQVQAVFSIKGPCYPVSDKELTQVITNVINPLTGSPWGNPIQSGSYTGLCAKLPNGCPGTASSMPSASTKSTPSSDSSASSTNSFKTPAPSPSPSPAAALSSPKPPNVGTTPLSGGGVIRSPSPSRRLLQGSSCSTYLYLDMTNPGDAEALIATVTDLVKSGEFLKKLTSGTSLEATEVYLQDIGSVQVALPPSPSPATKGGTAAALGSSPAQTLTLPDDLTSGILISDPPVDSNSGGSSSPSGSTITSFGAPSTSTTPTPTPTATTQPVLTPKSTTTAATDTTSDSSDSGSSSTEKIIIISATVGGVVLLAVFLGGAMVCLSNNNKQAKAKVQVDLIAHRRERMREKSKRPSFSSNTTLDRLTALRQAQAARESQAAREAQNSKRATPGSGRWAESSGGPAPSAHSVVVTPLQEPAVNSERSRVLNEGYERSSQPEIAPQAAKTGRFFGLFGSKG